jgi:hypothetical protein
MGFEASAADSALIRCGGDFCRALQALLGPPEVIPPPYHHHHQQSHPAPRPHLSGTRPGPHLRAGRHVEIACRLQSCCARTHALQSCCARTRGLTVHREGVAPRVASETGKRCWGAVGMAQKAEGINQGSIGTARGFLTGPTTPTCSAPHALLRSPSRQPCSIRRPPLLSPDCLAAAVDTPHPPPRYHPQNHPASESLPVRHPSHSPSAIQPGPVITQHPADSPAPTPQQQPPPRPWNAPRPTAPPPPPPPPTSGAEYASGESPEHSKGAAACRPTKAPPPLPYQ